VNRGRARKSVRALLAAVSLLALLGALSGSALARLTAEAPITATVTKTATGALVLVTTGDLGGSSVAQKFVTFPRGTTIGSPITQSVPGTCTRDVTAPNVEECKGLNVGSNASFAETVPITGLNVGDPVTVAVILANGMTGEATATVQPPLAAPEDVKGTFKFRHAKRKHGRCPSGAGQVCEGGTLKLDFSHSFGGPATDAEITAKGSTLKNCSGSPSVKLNIRNGTLLLVEFTDPGLSADEVARITCAASKEPSRIIAQLFNSSGAASARLENLSPCECTGVSVEITGAYTFRQKGHGGIHLSVEWEMSCTRGTGGCQGEVDALPPTPGDWLVVHPKKNVKCAGECETHKKSLHTGIFGEVVHADVPLDKLAGEGFFFHFVTYCRVNGELGKPVKSKWQIVLDDKGNIDRRRSDIFPSRKK
jgi:hypothetical protein